MEFIHEDTMFLLGAILAFGAGALSFLSPCVLPIFPAYLSYITGISVKDLEEKRSRSIHTTLLFNSLFFILGISLVYLSLGIGASFLGQTIQKLLTGDTGLFIQRLAGIFIMIMGLFVGGWFEIPFLMRERRISIVKKPIGYFGTFFAGVGFAAGWTPCIGPIFGSILFLATYHPAQGTVYTLFYIIGFILPFLVVTFFLGRTKWIIKYSGKLMKIGGLFMVVMGFILFSGQLPQIAKFFLRLVEDTWFENLG